MELFSADRKDHKVVEDRRFPLTFLLKIIFFLLICIVPLFERESQITWCIKTLDALCDVFEKNIHIPQLQHSNNW